MTIQSRFANVNVTTPPGTLITAPLVTQVTLGDAWLTKVDIRIPPGPSFLVGLAVVWNGAFIVPWASEETYLLGDDEPFSIPVGEEITRHLAVQTYNNDIYQHTVYFRFTYMPMTLRQASGLVVVQPVAVS